LDAPGKILLLRHAEKPGDPKDPYLTEAGRRRADRLAQFIPAMFGKPDFVFAAAVNKHSFRAYLTMRPLCDAIAVRPDTSFESEAYHPLANKLFSDPFFAGKLVVVCWAHKELPKLANALKARQGDYPDPWDDSVFNLILQFDYSDGVAPNVTGIVQPF
jgi:hypothetical protein